MNPLHEGVERVNFVAIVAVLVPFVVVVVVVVNVVEVGVLVVVVAVTGGGRDVESLRGLGSLEAVGGLAVYAETFESELPLRHGGEEETLAGEGKWKKEFGIGKRGVSEV